MKRILVLDIPGLTRGMVERHAPALRDLAARGSSTGIVPVLPAVTMPTQASVYTGLSPAQHGVVANGWFHRAHNEVMFWRQSEGLVEGETIWDAAKKRDHGFTCFKHFWWPGMASSADLYLNVRPAYFADGRKESDVYANLPGLAREIQEQFGRFPLFKFWGPGTGIESTKWIADTARFLMEREQPTLSMVYLPHLDYKQQTHGPDHPEIVQEIAALDEVVRSLITFCDAQGIGIVALSTYHMNAVDTPIHLNRLYREQGWLNVIENATGELIDTGTSKVFAVADHQSAQVYVRDPDLVEEVETFTLALEGVARVFDRRDQADYELNHAAAGELVVLAEKNAWFTYYYWLEDERAPDFARTIAIHAKPGYDPCELFLDPAIKAPKLKIARTLLKKKCGFRYVMDVIPLDAHLVKGSHGLAPHTPDEHPVFITSEAQAELPDELPMTEIKDRLLRMIFED